MTRLVPGLVAAVVSGVVYGLAFPPVRLGALAWVALVPLLLALRDAGWRRRLGLGVVWTLASGWTTGTWMPSAVADYFAQPLAVGIAIFLVVTGLMAAPYYAAFAVAYRPLTRFGAATPLLAAAAWAAAELARGRLLNGTLVYVGNSPWATLGYSQAGFTPVLQIAAVAGVYGVSFVVAAVNAAVADLVAGLVRGRGVDRAAWTGAAGAAATAGAAIGIGMLVTPGAAAPDAAGTAPDAARTPVAIVQANLGAAVRWSTEGGARTLETYQRLTRNVLAAGDPAIVFWPEAAVTAFIEQEDAHRHALGATLGGRGGELVIGALRAGSPGGGPPWANSIYVVAPDGALAARYDKQFLLPFMEYFPLRLDLARRRFGRVRELTPGGPTPPLPTRAGRAGVLVCNEAFLPHVAGARVADGATYLVNPSNDSWVPDPGFAWQQFDIASFRAVEQRRWLVRVSDSGPSGVVDPWGRVVTHSAALTRATLAAEIGAVAAPSIYGRVGDLFGVVCAVVVGIALAGAARRDH